MSLDLAAFEWLLVVAIDDVEVADDFLANLIAPSGPDVDARRQQLPSWRVAVESSKRPTLLRRLGVTGSVVSQGDQLRRSRQAVTTAVESINQAAVSTPPSELAAAWDEALRSVAEAELGSLVAPLDSTTHRVTPDDIAHVSRRLKLAARGLLGMRRQVALARIRSVGGDGTALDTTHE